MNVLFADGLRKSLPGFLAMPFRALQMVARTCMSACNGEISGMVLAPIRRVDAEKMLRGVEAPLMRGLPERFPQVCLPGLRDRADGAVYLQVISDRHGFNPCLSEMPLY